MRVDSVSSAVPVRLSDHTGELERLRQCDDDDRIDRAFNAVCRRIWGYTLDDFDDESLSPRDHAFLDRLTWKRACAFALEHGPSVLYASGDYRKGFVHVRCAWTLEPASPLTTDHDLVAPGVSQASDAT